MEQIKRRWPKVYDALKGAKPAAWTGAGRGKTVRLRDSAGKAVTLCSPRDPDAEAKSVITAQAGDHPDGPLVLLGVGLGHRINAALSILPEGGKVIAVICNRSAFLTGVTDGLLDRAFSDPRLELFIGDRDGIRELARNLDADSGCVIMHGPALRVAEEYAADAVRLADIISTHGFASSRLIEAVRENYRANLKLLCVDTPLADLRDLAKNLPVAVVGAGPSLESMGDALRGNRDKLVIVCVEAAVAPLHRLGVSADLAVSVDPFAHNARQCRSLPEYPPLVYMPSVHPEVPAKWRNRRIAALPAGDPVAEALNGQWEIGLLGSGGIVGTAAMALADYIGGNPLILAGMDLAFTQEKSHAFRDDKSIESKSSPYLTRVPAIGGGTAMTNETFKRAIAWFELFAKARPEKTCIDAGGAGALKQGYTLAAIDDALIGKTGILLSKIPHSTLDVRESEMRMFFKDLEELHS